MFDDMIRLTDIEGKEIYLDRRVIVAMQRFSEVTCVVHEHNTQTMKHVGPITRLLTLVGEFAVQELPADIIETSPWES